MNTAYTDSSIWIIGATFCVAGLPFLVLHIRDSLYEKLRTPKKDQMFNVVSTVVAIMFGMSVFFISVFPASAQDLFALSTDHGLEFYQVDAIERPSWLVNSHTSVFWTPPPKQLIGVSVDFLTKKFTLSSLRVLPGYSTTTKGRVFKAAGGNNWRFSRLSDRVEEKQESPSLSPQPFRINAVARQVAQQKLPGVQLSNSN